MTPQGSACTNGASHAWSEWRYSEADGEAIRECDACAAVATRSGTVRPGPGVESAEPSPVASPMPTPAVSTADVLAALGGTMVADACRGDFTVAARLADAAMAAAQRDDDIADAVTARAMVCLCQGDVSHAIGLLERVLEHTTTDANRTLRALSYRILAEHYRYNLFPDGNGANAVEISARWNGVSDLAPIDARWQAAWASASDDAVFVEAMTVSQFIAQLQSARAIAAGMRYAPTTGPLAAVLDTVTDPVLRQHDIATQLGHRDVAQLTLWAAADLYRRGGDASRATAMLDRASRLSFDRNDAAASALCLMTTADWQCAPHSSPLAWNLSVTDSSGAAGNLTAQAESDEATGGTMVSYRDAASRFRAAVAPRGVAAIELRHAYLASLRNDWPAVVRHAIHARQLFEACGDHRNAWLAATHVIMGQLSGAGVPGVDIPTLAADIGAWGSQSGSFSVVLGLGILINRCSRQSLLRRGDYERALAGAQAARALFVALGARINAAQCTVDEGSIYEASGERAAAFTCYERALDEYTALIDAFPAVAANLRQRVVFLATDVYQLGVQAVDADAMERATHRLRAQLGAMPAGASAQDAMATLFAQLTASLSAADAGQPMPDQDTASAMSAQAAMRQMAESTVRQGDVLAPLYRARAARVAGNAADAARWLAAATTALQAADAGERHFLRAVLLGERKQYDEAAEAMREHLRAGGANAGFVGDLAKLMAEFGGAQGAAEVALQARRTHEQAFALFVVVRAYDDAWVHLQALERLAGARWWTHDPKPWMPLCDMAELFEARGDTSRAMTAFDAAIEALEQRRAFLSRDELKVALAADKGAQYLYFLAARAAVRAGNASLGFAYAERGKSRALLDLMAGTRTPASQAEDEPTRAWRSAAMQVTLTRGLLAQARARQSSDAQRVALLESQLAEQHARLHDTERALAAVNPAFHSAMTTTGTVMSASEVCAALPDDTTLLEYFFLGDDLLVWALTRDGVAAHHEVVDAAALGREIKALHRACAQCEPWRDLAARLAERLLAPVAMALRGARHVMIVPHGAAHLLPFQVLPFDDAPLGITRAVSYLPSASALQSLQPRPNDSTPDVLLSVGNPTLDLPSACGEAESVAALFPDAVLLLEHDATEAAVRQHLGSASLLHLATHGVLDAETPLNSAILLAGNDSLTVYELMLLRLNARLVVLSACSTAQGEVTGGDDVVGFTRGLLAAGAQAAVVSLWEVDDASTEIFMRAFYGALREGREPRVALQQAQVHLRDLSDAEIDALTLGLQRRARSTTATAPDAIEAAYGHPYFWAPFVLVGHAW